MSTQPTRLSPRILIAFACVYVFWGSTYLAMRTGVEVLAPLALASTRFLISGPLMLGVCLLRGLPLGLTRRDLLLLIGIGILMLGIGNAGVVFAEQYIPTGLAALLFAAIPLYVALIEAILPRSQAHGSERLSARGWLGIAIGFLGIVTLLWPTLQQALSQTPQAPNQTSNQIANQPASHQLLGASIALAAALAWSAASVFSRRARIAAPTFVAAAYEMLFAGCFDLLLLLATGGSIRHIAWNRQAVLSVAWLVVFGSLVGYTAYIYLLDHVPVAKVATYAYINPIIAVLLGAILLSERMVPVEYAGTAAILAAVYLVTSSQLKSTPASHPVEVLTET